ncbi:hypothetical protein [Paenibacillus sp. CMAA1364]
MNAHPSIETEEDIQIVKEYTLLPVLLDMLARDSEYLAMYPDKLIYKYVIYHLQEIEQSIYSILHNLKQRMKQRQIIMLNTEMNRLGIDVEYQVRGYTHHFHILRSLIRAELITLLMSLRGGS